MADPERTRLAAADAGTAPWRRWGTYVSERQWGTVREDYSAGGDAWDYLTHDQARAHAYRWGEDGIGGFCDETQILCLAVALWNGNDPILKERLFGLTNQQGNHGEDVKEYYYYLDATPTCSYARMLYKYPQAAFPYERLLVENRQRGKLDPEFELIETGVFDADRYFDVVIEYAKADVDDILLRLTITNRGPDPAPLHVLPQVWFRNSWTWSGNTNKPSITAAGDGAARLAHDRLGAFAIHWQAPDALLFCDNETNAPKLYGSAANGPFKDGFDAYVVHGDRAAVNPAGTGTKASGLYQLQIPAGGSVSLRVRLSPGEPNPQAFDGFDAVIETRRAETDSFYAPLQTNIANADQRLVQRQAFAGMLWSKQFYFYNVSRWLAGDSAEPAPPESRRAGRNGDWQHVDAHDVISMPDKWEYPWFAAWDSAFHCVTLARIDRRFAKDMLLLFCREWYMHPNGQVPAYEWNFSDVNPPVQAWAAWQIYHDERRETGEGEIGFLERMFHKLLLNFTWWVNRKDPAGRNVFQGGFLGLDNISVFDRSAPLPTGGYLNQADGTAWMGMYCLNMLRISLELALHNPVYEDIASKFFEHFLAIAGSMTNIGGKGIGLWDDKDACYCDMLMMPDGTAVPLRLHSAVGFILLFAVEVLDDELLARLPGFSGRMTWYLEHKPELAKLVSRWQRPGSDNRRLLSIARAFRMKQTLKRVLDEQQFLSPYGIRALSREHLEHPYVFSCHGQRYEVKYLPAESDSGLFGGNSNWRGPIWMPVNYLLVESLRRFHTFYGDDFKVECPTGSGVMMTLWQVADEISRRLCSIFLAGPDGRRPVLGQYEKIAGDTHFRDHVLFHEYFHGDVGRGVGASHQTGWSGLVANLIEEINRPSAPTTPRT
jgi:Mannosyl oligosaccharide glucosidase.